MSCARDDGCCGGSLNERALVRDKEIGRVKTKNRRNQGKYDYVFVNIYSAMEKF